jgi:hypothetical protein
MDFAFLSRWALAGVFATLTMDLLGTVARMMRVAVGVPPPLIVKWFRGILSGRVFVEDIRTAPGDPGSMASFLPLHYTIGLLLGLMLGVGARLLGQEVSWPVALGFGLATTVAPALLMFPGMGFGVLGLDGPPEWRLLGTALINHLFFGVGLAAAAYFFSR